MEKYYSYVPKTIVEKLLKTKKQHAVFENGYWVKTFEMIWQDGTHAIISDVCNLSDVDIDKSTYSKLKHEVDVDIMIYCDGQLDANLYLISLETDEFLDLLHIHTYGIKYATEIYLELMLNHHSLNS